MGTDYPRKHDAPAVMDHGFFYEPLQLTSYNTYRMKERKFFRIDIALERGFMHQPPDFVGCHFP
jgi:hypothetical protein